MDRRLWIFLLIVLMAGWMGSGCVGPDKNVAKKGLGPTVVAFPAMVKMDKKATLTLIGTGFSPGKKIKLIMITADGITTDIDYSFQPEPIPNEMGTWISEWKDCGRFISEGLVKEGVFTITVADSQYNALAHVPVVFFSDKPAKEEKKK